MLLTYSVRNAKRFVVGVVCCKSVRGAGVLGSDCGLAVVRGVYAQERCDGRILEQRPRHAHRPQRLPLLVYVDESGRYEWHGYEEQPSRGYG